MNHNGEYNSPEIAKSRTSKILAIGLVLLVAIVMIAVYYIGENEKEPSGLASSQMQVTEPVSGHIFQEPFYHDRVATLTIQSECPTGLFVVLDLVSLPDDSAESNFSNDYKALSRSTEFYIRAGETVTLSVPLGTYQIYFATGEKWLGVGELYGSTTSYWQNQETILYADSMQDLIVINPTKNGYSNSKSVDAETFFKLLK